MSETCDYLVAGGGIVGISVARELKRRFPRARVVLLEKERQPALHSSGRNSGVLHAGFYYTADSLKARFTRVGNERLTRYCETRGLPINRCGKLVVAKDASELPALDELLRRGAANGVELRAISAAEAGKIEPRAKSFERALFSPTTSSVDPVQVTLALHEDARREGVEVRLGEAYLQRGPGGVRTTHALLDPGYFVNCAGLYADRVALDFGFSAEYRILPFKGLYLYSEEHEGAMRTHLYPVPDLRNPFLGVHFTLTVDGHLKIGPTAIPALWREHYGGLEGFSAGEFAEVLWRELGLFLHAGFDFRRLALEEVQKHSRRRMVALASVLARGVELRQYVRWGRPGIRAQLVHIGKKKLEMDFVIQGDRGSLHVLNAVSPAFTCAMPFAEHVCDKMGEYRA
jgi:L-2-hydroxyglutarate oxidase LhgO